MESPHDTTLAHISKAKQFLAAAQSLEDTQEVMDAASAAEAYARAIKSDELAQVAIEIKLRAERKAGEFLRDDPEIGPGKGSKLEPLRITKQDSHRWQRIASIPEDKFEDYLLNAKKRTQLALLRLANGAHVGNATGEFEWYTPRKYIEAARLTMGTIDVDPASSEVANEIVRAKKYYTKENDGLLQDWPGNIWMNPPYSQPLITKFCNLLVEKYVVGEVDQACVLVNNATETEFYQNMLRQCKAVCFINGRIKFIDENGDSTGAPLQGQTVLYFGDNVVLFAENFSYFGVILNA